MWVHCGRAPRIVSHKGEGVKNLCVDNVGYWLNWKESWWIFFIGKVFFFFCYSINLFYYFLEKNIFIFFNLRNSINTKIKLFLRHIRTQCDPIDNKIILNKSKSYKAEINKIKITQLNWILDIIKECNL